MCTTMASSITLKKSDNARAWLLGKAQVMCATSPFGMDIDKPDEVGRAVASSAGNSLGKICSVFG